MQVTFSGYPTHATQPSQLPAPLFVALSTFATAVGGAIMATQFTRNVINLIVEGHADRDPQGAAFEMKISQDRADNCKTLLIAQVTATLQAAFFDLNHLKRLSIATIGWGATRRVIENPTNEADREANRRVDVTFLQGNPLPQVDDIDSARRALAVLDGQGEGGRLRRLRCMLTKIRDVADVADGYPDFEAGHRIPGSGGFPNLPPDQWPTAINSFMVHVKPQVSSVMQGGTADQQRTGLLAIDDNIGRNIFNWMSQLNAGAATGIFDQVVVAFIQNQMANQRSVLSCYVGYSRANPDQ